MTARTLTENTGGKPLQQWLDELAAAERHDSAMQRAEDVQQGRAEQPEDDLERRIRIG